MEKEYTWADTDLWTPVHTHILYKYINDIQNKIKQEIFFMPQK